MKSKFLLILVLTLTCTWIHADSIPEKNPIDPPSETLQTPPFDWSKVPALPPLDWLEQTALRRAGIQPELVSQWQKNARWSAALPKIQIGWDAEAVQQNTAIVQDSISVTTTGVNIGPASNRLDYDAKNNRNLEVKAVWSFDELLFNPQQLAISREARDLNFVRQQVIQELHLNYFALKSHLVQCQLDPVIAEDPLSRVKAEEWIAKLDAMTGGEFRRLLREEAQRQKWVQRAREKNSPTSKN